MAYASLTVTPSGNSSTRARPSRASPSPTVCQPAGGSATPRAARCSATSASGAVVPAGREVRADSDFEDRLRAAGLAVTTIVATDVIPASTATMLGLPASELLWLCTRADVTPDKLVIGVREALPGVLMELLRRTGATAIAERDRLQTALGKAQGTAKPRRSLPRRAASYARRRLRRLAPRLGR